MSNQDYKSPNANTNTNRLTSIALPPISRLTVGTTPTTTVHISSGFNSAATTSSPSISSKTSHSGNGSITNGLLIGTNINPSNSINSPLSTSPSRSSISQSRSQSAVSVSQSDSVYYTPRTVFDSESSDEKYLNSYHSISITGNNADPGNIDHPFSIGNGTNTGDLTVIKEKSSSNNRNKPSTSSSSAIKNRKSSNNSGRNKPIITASGSSSGAGSGSGSAAATSSSVLAHTSSTEAAVLSMSTVSSSVLLSNLEIDLFRCCRHGHHTEVERLLSLGLGVDTLDKFGNTPLIVAAQNGNKRICKLLLRAGALLNTQNATGNSCLHYCYAFGYRELAAYLISKGANPNLINKNGLLYTEGIEKPKPANNRINSNTTAAGPVTGYLSAADGTITPTSTASSA